MIDENIFNKLKVSDFDLEEEIEKDNYRLRESYLNIIDILKEYCDLKEDYYHIIALWIIGSHIHNTFLSYPYLFLNAMKGSGKSRTLKLITYLAKDGSMLNSLTEAVLFRSSGTLGIDEFEGVNRKGLETLKELLNSAYKKGTKVKRMKKQKVLGGGEEQVVEEFDVFRPIVIANISGMDNVLSDRCLTLVVDKSNKSVVTNLVELWEFDEKVTITKGILEKFGKSCSKCSVDVVVEVYKGWNNYVKKNYTNNTNTTINSEVTTLTTPSPLTTITTLTTPLNKDYNNLYKKLMDSNINGRDLELCLPLIIISEMVGEVDSSIEIMIKIVKERKSEDAVESLDVSLINYISQEVEGKWMSSKELFNNFKNIVQVEEKWFNDKWLGRALKRLNLYKEKKRMNYGVLYFLNVELAQKKMEMFK